MTALADLPRGAVAALAGLVTVVLAALLLPEGVPVGVVALGLVYGATTGLTALGLVLVHRASRVVNFAQAEVGGLAVAVAVLTVTGWGLPYPVGVGLGLVVAGLTGAVVDRVVVRRFRRAPRLILTVATIGVAQILGAAQLGIPGIFGDLRPFSTFATPFDVSFSIGDILFTGDHIVAVAAALLATFALRWFLTGSDLGTAIRAAADSEDRARLLGIPVAKLSRITWVVAALLSGLGALVLTPIQGVSVGAVAGASSLLPTLTAAVIGRMTSLPVTMAAALGLGVVEQVIFWSYPRSSVVSVLELAIVLVALLWQRRSASRTSEPSLAAVVPPVRPIPEWLRELPAIRGARIGATVLGVGLLAVAPLVVSDSQVSILTSAAIFTVIGISLVVLVGWAGQISLGQFAFVGIGAGVAGGLITTANTDLFVALAAAAAIGAIAASVIGIPALRIPGLLLGVATLAFAVPVSEYLLSSTNFPALTPAQVERPELFGSVSIDSEQSFFWFCAGTAVLLLWGVSNLRRSRVGRAVLAVRDNERAAAMVSLSASRTRVLAFGLSGAIAGLAGGLYVLSVRGIGFGAFNPNESLEVFTMVVVGGLGSLSGAVLGAAYVQIVGYFLDGATRLLATGGGMLLLLLVLPGGLGEAAVRLRDRGIRSYVLRAGITRSGFVANAPRDDDTGGDVTAELPVERDGAVTLRVSGLTAGYGSQRILHGVSLGVAPGEILALLGTNGAGKSTLLRSIAGLLDAGGEVALDAEPLGALAAEERAALGISLLPGGAGVFPNLTVDENVRVAGWLLRGDDATRREREAGLFAAFPRLAERRRSDAGDLSGGEQQMLAIGMATMGRPRLLLIDELSLGLAPKVVAELLEVVRSTAETGVAVVLVEQSLNVAAAVAPRAVFLERGRIRFDGPTLELTERGDLARAVFLGAAAETEVKRPARARKRPTAVEGPPALDVIDATVRYRGITALDAAALTVGPGEIVGLIGSNGAGKTTLLDVCSGFSPTTSGRVLLQGRDVTAWGPDPRAAIGLGRIFQDARLFPSLTVAETVAAACERFTAVREPIASALRVRGARVSEADVRERVGEILEELGLEDFANRFINELSTGTRRIVELACVLAHRPSTLLLDEPTSGLAQRESEALAAHLTALRERTGMAMLIVEHDIPMVRSIADRLVCLHLGAVIATGDPAAVLADPMVVESYLGTDHQAIERSGPRRRASSRARSR